MNKVFSLAALSTALVCMTSVSAYAESTEQELIGLEKQAYQAIIAKNYDKMRKLLADDWVQQDDSDDKITRESMISRLKSGQFIPESGTFGPMDVNVHGDIATVMGTVEERFVFAGKR